MGVLYTNYIGYVCMHRRAYDRTVALQRMLASGVTMTTSESLVFDLMKTKDHPNFKEISSLVKEHNKSGTNEFATSTTL